LVFEETLELNNGREIMVIKYAEDTKQGGSASTLEDSIRM